jgi:hypothetical protein
MVQLLGFDSHEEILVHGLIAQFSADDYRMAELRLVEKCDLPGYNGLVVPVHCDLSNRFHMTLQLAAVNPFTLAHELAHVSDISTRRQETRDHLRLEMPTGWHLAHRMSSEYYANRVACAYADEADIFQAFQNDCAGLRTGAHGGDWAAVLIHYALLLGIMHGMDRAEIDPAHLLGTAHLPEPVRAGMHSFRHQASAFFDGYGDGTEMAQAA